jgi:Tol biopolymer transport system component
VTGSIVRITTSLTESFAEPSLSADASRLIVTASYRTREVWKVPFGPEPSANGRQSARLVDESLDPMWTFVTRDGRTLLFNNALVGSRNLWTMPLDRTSEPRQITSMAGDAVTHSSLSPDGMSVAFASTTGGTSDIWVQRVDGSNLQQLIRFLAGVVSRWSVHPLRVASRRNMGHQAYRTDRWCSGRRRRWILSRRLDHTP